LTENVKKIDLGSKIHSEHNKENCASKRSIPVARKAEKLPVLDQYLAEEFHIEQVEPIDPTGDQQFNDESDLESEPIDPSYAMDYIADIMNLLYAMEKKYPIQSSFLAALPTTMTTMANGSASKLWKMTSKHRTIVIGWIIQLFYARFHLSQDALHM
jgi:hypothetical protein